MGFPVTTVHKLNPLARLFGIVTRKNVSPASCVRGKSSMSASLKALHEGVRVTGAINHSCETPRPTYTVNLDRQEPWAAVLEGDSETSGARDGNADGSR